MELMWEVLPVGATLNWDIHQMDIKTAFLHGNLVEEVYMVQLMGGKEPGKEDRPSEQGSLWSNAGCPRLEPMPALHYGQQWVLKGLCRSLHLHLIIQTGNVIGCNTCQ